ncbi:MalY/PatB family protein [Frankia torreyi]|uniref:MalY/PatB family protein n=1 Tax=Frankia torreyi TaxID=1856 RepID=UPI001A7EF141|nr:aminotransferase class I/II-fold pyridoxal phosphate-dependent enzyme [Frankia torreyi]
MEIRTRVTPPAGGQGSGALKWEEAGAGAIGAGTAEMDVGTAPPVLEALRRAVTDGLVGYLPAALDARLREACAGWLWSSQGWAVDPALIQPVPSVLHGLRVTIERYTPPGSAVIVPVPAYPPFLAVPGLLGRQVLPVPLVDVNGRPELDLDGIDGAFRRGGGLVVLCNPHNPVGRVFTPAELLALSAVVNARGGRVFADEIHAPFVYPGRRHQPYAALSPLTASHTLTATSASKGWNIAGLRCALLITSHDDDLAQWRGLGRFDRETPSVLGAIASTAAFRDGVPWLRRVLAGLATNRRAFGDLLAEFLPEVTYRPPEATYLAWLDCRRLTLGGTEPAAFFSALAGVSLLEGSDCGSPGRGFARFNFATEPWVLVEALRRMATAVADAG